MLNNQGQDKVNMKVWELFLIEHRTFAFEADYLEGKGKPFTTS